MLLRIFKRALRRVRTSRVHQAGCLALMLAAAPLACAQLNAALYGTVYDASGNPMPAVTVTLENPALAFSRTTTSGSDGTYNFAEVPPAENYKLTASKGGKRLDIRTGISLHANDERVVLPPLKDQAPPTIGQNKVDLYKLAETAAGVGKIEDAQRFYCQVAQMDPDYKDSQLLCAIMMKEIEKDNKNNQEHFKLGVKSFNQGKYDAAQHEFENIRWGPRLKEAQEYLNVKIPQARRPAANETRSSSRPTVRWLNPPGGTAETAGTAILAQGVAVGFNGVEKVELAGIALPTEKLADGSVEFHTILPLAMGQNTFQGVVVGTSGSRVPLKLEIRRVGFGNEATVRAPGAPPLTLKAPGPPPLTLEEVETALRNELPKDRIAALANQYGVDFEVTDDVDKRLRRVGADSRLLLDLVKAYHPPAQSKKK